MWTKAEQKVFRALRTPVEIQAYLDALAYDTHPEDQSPRGVMRRKKADCLSGALFAAAALQELGFRPLLLDLRAVNDDDHVLAVFQKNGCWGAIAKSNFTTLRFREPVYRSLRELAMSYFDFYFNSNREKTLREFSLPLNLRRLPSWETVDMDDISLRLDKLRHFRVLTSQMEKKLSLVSPGLLKAGLMGADSKGLYKPKSS